MEIFFFNNTKITLYSLYGKVKANKNRANILIRIYIVFMFLVKKQHFQKLVNKNYKATLFKLILRTHTQAQFEVFQLTDDKTRLSGEVQLKKDKCISIIKEYIEIKEKQPN